MFNQIISVKFTCSKNKHFKVVQDVSKFNMLDVHFVEFDNRVEVRFSDPTQPELKETRVARRVIENSILDEDKG